MNTSRAPPSNQTLPLKANILVDQNGHALLADFGFLTVVSDSANPTASSSYTAGGTIRWMSPELLFPDRAGLEGNRPTKQSDCYALAMVIYEVLGGQVPFAPFSRFVVIWKVIDGERPQRPEGVEGARFTNELWQMLNRCWGTRPESRPDCSAVLECLEQVSRDTKLPSLGNTEADEERSNLTSSLSRVFSWFDLRRFVALLNTILC